MMNIDYRELIRRSSSSRKKEYVDFFFKTIVGTHQKPIVGKDDDSVYKTADIAIVKDSQEKRSRFGNKYIEHNLRTCVFYYIDKKDAFEYLNDSNKENYRFEPNDVFISWDSSNGFPSNIINKTLLDEVNKHVLNAFKLYRSSWFIRSYVYFILVLCDDDGEISPNDFCIHYWNNKYKIKKVSKKPLFGRSKSLSFVEDVPTELKLIDSENKDSIDCVKAYYGKLDFFPQSEEAYTDIKNDVDSGINYLLCQGAARTGKTVLAMRFLHEYPDFKLLLLNYYFYQSLKDAFAILNVKFPSDRIFHHDLRYKNGCWISGSYIKRYKLDLTHLIVDEAQRLGIVESRSGFYGTLPKLDEIDDIISCNNHACTLFFGDDSQMLNSRYDQGFSVIKQRLSDKDYREYYFSDPLGVPPEVIKNVRFLLGFDNSSPHPINQFSISIEKDEKKFIDSYLKNEQRKKHLIVPVIDNEVSDSVVIGEHSFMNTKNMEESFRLFDKDIQKEYYLSAYSVISREIEWVYLYLPKHIHLDKEGNICISGYRDNNFLLNEYNGLIDQA